MKKKKRKKKEVGGIAAIADIKYILCDFSDFFLLTYERSLELMYGES